MPHPSTTSPTAGSTTTTGSGLRPLPISRRHWRPLRWTSTASRRASSTPPTSTRPRSGSGRGSPSPAFTERYWGRCGRSFPTDWKKGSTYDVAYREAGLVISDPAQVILESDPYRRLSYTWHTFTPEWGDRHGRSTEEVARLAPRAALEGRLRHRGGRPRNGQADRRPRRIRAGERHPGRGQRRLARSDRRPEDASRVRLAPFRRPSERARRRRSDGRAGRRRDS